MGKDGEEGRLMEMDWRWVSTGVPRGVGRSRRELTKEEDRQEAS